MRASPALLGAITNTDQTTNTCHDSEGSGDTATTTTERNIVDTTNKADIAYDRGFVRGSHDRAEGFHNEAPLSGEWAGESIPELLGDLLDEDFGNFDEVCERYEEGYNNAFVA